MIYPSFELWFNQLFFKLNDFSRGTQIYNHFSKVLHKTAKKIGNKLSTNCCQKNFYNVADFKLVISPSSRLKFGRFFFEFNNFSHESNSVICFCKFCTKSFISYLQSLPALLKKVLCGGRSTCIKFVEYCYKTLKLKYAPNPHSHGAITYSDFIDQNIGDRPQIKMK